MPWLTADTRNSVARSIVAPALIRARNDRNVFIVARSHGVIADSMQLLRVATNAVEWISKMPGGPQGEKRPADVVGICAATIATGEVLKDCPAENGKDKAPPRR